MNFNSRHIGIIQIIFSGICFGSLGFFGKKAYLMHITPGELLALRYFVSAILTAILIMISNPKSFFSLTKFEIISSLMLGIFGYALFSSFFFLALSGLSASLTVLLLYTYPVMIMLISHFFLNEPMTSRDIKSIFLVTIGLIGLVWGEWKVSRPIFLLFGLGAAFFYSIYILFSHKFLKKTSPLPSSFFVQLGAGVVLSLIHFSSNPIRLWEILSQHSLFILTMAILCSLMAMTLFLAGLQKVSSTEASILSTSEPISGVLIALVFLGEKFSIIQFIGGTLILLGMILTSIKSKEVLV